MSSALIQAIEKRYYTLGQAAQELHHSRQTLWRWAKTGQLQVYHIGREVLIEKAVIDALRKGS